MAVGAYNAVRVGDLEIAMVLAKELRTTPGTPSLTLGQLRAVFGATQLDSAERERIDAALEAAGLHAEPSVLHAHPGEALAFRVAGNGDAGGRASPGRRFARTVQAPATEAAAPAAPGGRGSVAAVVAGVLLPVLFTSVAGWRFGLAFVAFTAIAAGLLFSRAEPAALLRQGRTFLLAIGGLCVLSLLAAAALGTAGAASP
jgi:hypothetical protein